MAQILSIKCYKGEALRLNFCLNPFTETTGSTTAGAATVNVKSTAAFPATGTVYIEGVAVTYTGVTATTFTGCTNVPTTTYPVPVALGGVGVPGCIDASTFTTVFTVKKHANDATSLAIISQAGVLVSGLGAVFKVNLTKAQTKIAPAAYACDFWRTDSGSEAALGVGDPASGDGDFTVLQDVLN